MRSIMRWEDESGNPLHRVISTCKISRTAGTVLHLLRVSALLAENVTVTALIYGTRGSQQRVTQRTGEQNRQQPSQLLLILHHLLQLLLLHPLLLLLSLHSPGLVPLDHSLP